ncbi:MULTISPECIES: hypothetical protein [Myroides]|uniref:DUF7832 domain-containing protein n=1 Tax=Myroides albus TaxID=2562892 RepID=A0A6I3LSS6_9FLAO|nr:MULTISPECIES: hypothetical protein [Myroides]MTG99142.1 hypothetical protein [Myroides albus]MVX36778.1 hypothetical protein [Myroides sp. LoEW2-1]UVD79901.1 hypothetical protein NWE55_01010 [Myroides albus]
MGIVKYDDYAWHHSGEFPVDLAYERGATHIGFFFTWCVINHLVSEEPFVAFKEDLEAVRKKRLSGASFLLDHFNGRLLSVFFNEMGNNFIEDYYEDTGVFAKRVSNYLDDYIQTFHLKHPDRVYYIEDCWENYYDVEETLDHRFEQWQKTRI